MWNHIQQQSTSILIQIRILICRNTMRNHVQRTRMVGYRPGVGRWRERPRAGESRRAPAGRCRLSRAGDSSRPAGGEAPPASAQSNNTKSGTNKFRYSGLLGSSGSRGPSDREVRWMQLGTQFFCRYAAHITRPCCKFYRTLSHVSNTHYLFGSSSFLSCKLTSKIHQQPII